MSCLSNAVARRRLVLFCVRLLLQCAMPVAVNNYLFALRWNNNPEEVAGTVVVSTLASVVTLPALLWFLL